MNLYDAIATRLEKPVRGEDPIAWARETLKAYATWSALLEGNEPESWDVYCERHVAGFRFAIYDATGAEIDLQAITYTEPKKKPKPPEPRRR